MLLDWEEEVSTEGGVATWEGMTGAGLDEVVEVVCTGAVVDDCSGSVGVSDVVEVVCTGAVVNNCASVLEAGSVGVSGACKDWTGVALTSCFCWTATDGRDETMSVVVVLTVGPAIASALDDEHSEGASLSFSHFKVPSSIPLQTSFWPTSLPLRTKATTVGPGISTVLKTSEARLA